MIITITRQTTRLALRLRNTFDGRYLQDYKNLQLVIRPPQIDPCHIGGSPWYLTGCWPFHPTCVDVANPPRPDFPAMTADAFEVDKEGRIVFIIPKKLYNLPNGRYEGVIRVHHSLPINYPRKDVAIYPWGQLGAQVHLEEGKGFVPCELPKCVIPEPKPACELYKFDIDLGPECAAHMVDQCAVDFTKPSVYNC